MIYKIVSQLVNGEEVQVGTRGCEDIEINDLFNEVDYFSYDNSKTRLVALRKRGIFRLTLDSYKAMKKELTKKGVLWRFNYEKR